MDVHPFRAVWQTRDLDAWSDALAPDVVAHSPILKAPWIGREAVAELYDVLLGSLGSFEIAAEFGAGHLHVFFWRADAGGSAVEGVDLVRTDDAGKIVELKVFLRPFAGLAGFASTVGPRFSARQGRIRALLLRFLNLPLKILAALADVIVPPLLLRKGWRP